MKNYKCLIAPVGTPEEETIVTIIAENIARALVENYNQRPGTYVKEISESEINDYT